MSDDVAPESVGGRSETIGEGKSFGHVLNHAIPDVPGIGGQAAPAIKSVAGALVDDRLEESEKLNALPEWAEFSPLQRQIVLARLEDPLADDKVIAKRAGCSVRTVVKLQHSSAYEKVTDELVKAGKTRLRLAALDVMATLLRAEKESVRLDAAKSILRDGNLLKEPEKTTNHNKRIQVEWKAPKQDKP